MARKKHEEEHENHERWLVSYADFITLLFAFFVVMYSVSRVDNKKLQQAAQSIKWALNFSGQGGVGQMPIFDGPLSEGGNILGMSGGQHAAGDSPGLENLRRRISDAVAAFALQRTQGAPPAVTVAVEDQRMVVRLAAADFFDPGQAVLRPPILPVLDAIANELATAERPLRVEGHTDSSPTSGVLFADNWELSATRAATVASYLERAHHLRPDLLSASGFADTRPIAPADAPDARELNRRVELVLEFEVKAPTRAHRQAPRMEPIPK